MIRSALFAATLVIATPCFAQEAIPVPATDSQTTTPVMIDRADLNRLCANWQETSKGRVMKTMLLSAMSNATAMAAGGAYAMLGNMNSMTSEMNGVLRVNKMCRK